jgi:acyl-CoA dehydrogenase
MPIPRACCFLPITKEEVMWRYKLTRDETNKYLSQDPKISDTMSSLLTHYKIPKSKAMYKEIDYVVALARKFNEEVVKPAYKKIDLETTKDPDYLCWDFIKKANEWGFF